MKTPTSFNLAVALAGILFTAVAHADDPRTNSWFTTYSGKYARIYTNDTMKTAGTALTNWSNGSQTQSSPAYCGVQEIYSSTSWVYVRSSGLGSHVMGPWYLNAQHTTMFPNLPVNQKVLWRFPRSPSASAANAQTSLGTIGLFVDGVAMFDSSDGYVWTGSGESGNGTGYWHREAYANEGVTFDPGYAHQENTGTHHYHANPIALRFLLGDHVDYNATTRTYSESTNAATKHSPILGWVRDGYPVYGPYAYSNALDASSPIIKMRSGFQLRNGQNGTDNITVVGRTDLPAWAQRLYGANSSGPSVSTTYPIARYMEDYAFLADLTNSATGTNYRQGVEFDLDEHNGRWCVTPEFPAGTYAYFVSIETNGTPKYPNNIGRTYYGNPNGSSVSSISEQVVTNFLGGPNATPSLNAPTVKNGVVTLTWSATEGGTYMVQSTTNFSTWTTNSTAFSAVLNAASYTNNPTDNARFYRVARTALATYDSAGTGGYTQTFSAVAPGGSATRSTTVTVTITLPSTPPWPPAGAPITSVTLAGSIAGTGITDTTQGQVVATFTIPANASTGTQSIVIVFNNGPTYTVTGLTIN